MSNDTQVEQEPDVERWKRDLADAGWTAESATAWRAPDGGLWRGPFGAWHELQRRVESEPTPGLEDAPERIWIDWPPTTRNNYIYYLKSTGNQRRDYVNADLLATVRREAFKEAIAIIVGQPTQRYIYSGACPMASDTFRDNAVKAIEAVIAIERQT